MLDSNDSKRPQNQDQEKLCPGDGSTHVESSPYTAHFNELLSLMSTDVMETLLTVQQTNFVISCEEAFSGGVRPTKKSRRELYEWVLSMDHKRQHEEQIFYQKNAKL